MKPASEYDVSTGCNQVDQAWVEIKLLPRLDDESVKHIDSLQFVPGRAKVKSPAASG